MQAQRFLAWSSPPTSSRRPSRPTSCRNARPSRTGLNELWIIDPARTRQNLDHATTLTAGSAVQEMRAFIKQERMFGRMEESPNLRRDPTVLSTDFIADDIAIVRLALTERENGIPKPPTYKSMTIHFVTSTPKSYQEVRRSMIGLTISDFTWSDARGMETLQ
ncbi:type IV secretion system protein (plasmid) [Burkholderia gladioli]|uniref:type IV secretion system protein n=1 Tax=Burkholderia gladioli TaxID=28095 RepID=UPI003B97F921